MVEPYHVSNSLLSLKLTIVLFFICLVSNVLVSDSAVTSVPHSTDPLLLSPWGFFLFLFWIGSPVFNVFSFFIYSLILMGYFYQKLWSCLSENVFMLYWHLIGIVAEYRLLVWNSFSLRIFIFSLHCLLVSIQCWKVERQSNFCSVYFFASWNLLLFFIFPRALKFYYDVPCWGSIFIHFTRHSVSPFNLEIHVL